MKRRRLLLLSIPVVALLFSGCGLWVWQAKRQYALNRQLIAALQHGDTKTARAVVNRGADPNTRYTPLPAPSFKLLLDQFLHHTPPPVNDSPTALMLACGRSWNSMSGDLLTPVDFHEDLLLVQAMLAHGANVHIRASNNYSGQNTALHFAVEQDCLSTMRLLLQHGAGINAQEEWGGTPLMTAASNSTANALRLLLAQGANPNLQNTQGQTALHLAAEYDSDDVEMVKCLVSKGAKVNQQDRDGNTPLMAAVKPGNVRCIGYLLAHGAAVNIKNHYGSTALSLARRDDYAQPHVARLLQQAGAKE